MLAETMNQPVPQQLHAALARSFAAPHTREQVCALVELLDADLRRPAGERGAEPIPRIVLFLALWRIVERQVPSALSPPHRLQRLVGDAFGCTLAEIDQWRALRVDAWRLIARQFGILDYVWTPPSETADCAALSVLVQTPVHELTWILDPIQWTARCALFWSDVTAVETEHAGTQFDALFKPPTSSLEATLPVRVTIEPTATTLGFDATLEVASRDAATPLHCNGFLRAEKEQGRPWTTRITQRKSLLHAPHPSEMLAYWTQAETLCLALGSAVQSEPQAP
jgi:hypothetical protein